MASDVRRKLGRLQLILVVIFFSFSLFFNNISIASSRKLRSDHQSSSSSSNHGYLHYHNGTLLTGRVTIHLLWYGKFKPSQRAIVSDFITSLSENNNNHQKQPSVSTWWWKAIHKYYDFAGAPPPARLYIKLGKQILDRNYTLGKSLSQNQIVQVAAAAAAKGKINGTRNAVVVNVVLTAEDVAVEGFCRSKCGTHGYSNENINTKVAGKRKNYKLLAAAAAAYIWVGNSEAQCPGYCAWPFLHHHNHHQQQPPQNQSLIIISPNNDMGMDGMVANFAGLLAATVTNPFGNGFYYYKGDEDEDDAPPTTTPPLEAASVCTGVYAAYLDLLVDPIVGASYNANGANGRRYLVPAIYDPITSTCSTHI